MIGTAMANQTATRASLPTEATTNISDNDPAFWNPRRRTRYGWLIAVVLLLLMMISWADKAILGIVAVPLMEDLNITEAQFGLLGSAVFMLFGIAQLVAAPIANRVHAQWKIGSAASRGRAGADAARGATPR